MATKKKVARAPIDQLPADAVQEITLYDLPDLPPELAGSVTVVNGMTQEQISAAVESVLKHAGLL